ncbi:MAG: hypothetical protein JNL72_15080 [Flavipsychrobacter sp.]|nr:hypothetical protein [Flavipsychrobacter sp.]
MYQTLLVLALMVCVSAQAQPKKKPAAKPKKTTTSKSHIKPLEVTPLQRGMIPKGLLYEGNVKNAVRWTDKTGENIVVTTETGEYETKKSMTGDGYSAQLFAYHYYIRGGKVEASWKVTDRIVDCPLDIQVHFIKNSFNITDLDHDGIAEVWLMYKTGCHGDVSPCDMKIIMYEGGKKHAIRGTNKVKLSEKEVYGGAYTPDEAFKKAPKPIQEYARKLWAKNELEEWRDD